MKLEYFGGQNEVSIIKTWTKRVEQTQPIHWMEGCRSFRKGVEEAKSAGRKLKEAGIEFDIAYTS